MKVDPSHKPAVDEIAQDDELAEVLERIMEVDDHKAGQSEEAIDREVLVKLLYEVMRDNDQPKEFLGESVPESLSREFFGEAVKT